MDPMESSGATPHTQEGAHREQENAWMAEQAALRERLDRTHDLDVSTIKYIAGVDISFFPGTDDACAALVILSFPELKVVCEASCHTSLTLPYIPTFLAFREIPALLPLFDMIPREFCPQVVLVDGNGELHPRGFGIASHLGVVTELPTIGVAKTFLNVDGLTKRSVRALVQEKKAQARAADGNGPKSVVALRLQGKSSKVWGMAMCTEGIENPIYVSIGNLISLPRAVEIVQHCSLFRVPEPIRQADLRSRKVIRTWEKHGVDTAFKTCRVHRHLVKS